MEKRKSRNLVILQKAPISTEERLLQMISKRCDSEGSDNNNKRIKIEENSYPDTTNSNMSEQSCCSNISMEQNFSENSQQNNNNNISKIKIVDRRLLKREISQQASRLKFIAEGRLAIHHPPTTEMGAFIVQTSELLGTISNFLNHNELDSSIEQTNNNLNSTIIRPTNSKSINNEQISIDINQPKSAEQIDYGAVLDQVHLLADEDPNKLSNIVLKQLTTLISYQAEEIRHLRENNTLTTTTTNTSRNNNSFTRGFDQTVFNPTNITAYVYTGFDPMDGNKNADFGALIRSVSTSKKLAGKNVSFVIRPIVCYLMKQLYPKETHMYTFNECEFSAKKFRVVPLAVANKISELICMGFSNPGETYEFSDFIREEVGKHMCTFFSESRRARSKILNDEANNN